MLNVTSTTTTDIVIFFIAPPAAQVTGPALGALALSGERLEFLDERSLAKMNCRGAL
jgi:hypothetical protein